MSEMGQQCYCIGLVLIILMKGEVDSVSLSGKFTNCVVIRSPIYDTIVNCYETRLKLVRPINLKLYQYEIMFEIKLEDQDMQLSLSNDLVLSGFYFNCDYIISLIGFRSIQIDYWTENLLCYESQTDYNPVYRPRFEFSFTDLKFEFGDREEKRCDLAQLSDLGVQVGGMFLTSVVFEHEVGYFENTCSVLFYQSRMVYIQLKGMTNSLIQRNILSFAPLTFNQTLVDLEHQISEIYLSKIYRANISSEILTKQILSTKAVLYVLEVEGILGRVQPYFFRHGRFKEVKLIVRNMKEFLLTNTKLTQGLDQYKQPISIILDQTRLLNGEGSGNALAFSKFDSYDFEEEDLCAFKDYPAEKRSIRFLVFGCRDKSQCQGRTLTCPILFLMQNALQNLTQSEKAALANAQKIIRQISSPNFSVPESLSSCELPKRFSRCSLKNQSIEFSRSPDFYDLILTVELFKFVFGIVLHPVFCFLGLVLNLLSVYAIKRIIRDVGKEGKRLPGQLSHLRKYLWKYLMYNAVFSALFCLVNMPKLLTDCVRFHSVYCSWLIANDHMRLFYMVGIAYGGSFLQLCANFTQFLFTLYRYLMNAASKRGDRLLKWRPQIVTLVFTVISLGLSVPQLFYNSRVSLKTFKSVKGFDSFLNSNRSSFIIETNLLILIFYCLNVLLNDAAFILTNLLIDLRLVSFIQSSRKPNVAMTTNSTSQKQMIEQRLTRMIILNGISTVLLKSPLIVVSFVKIFDLFNKSAESLCVFSSAYFDSICINLLAVFETLSISCFSLNFLLFFILNLEFRRKFYE
nr:G protein-coupled receptor [Proales similis]